MLNQVTLEKMQHMKLFGMAGAMSRPARGSDGADLSFEDRLGLLIDAEWEVRESRKLTNRLRQARLRYPASLEDISYAPRRSLDKKVILALGTCEWIREKQNVVITGAAGTGKSYLACALVERACRSGFSAAYVRSARLLHDLSVARGDGSYRRALVKLAKLDVLAIDDWLLTPPTDSERRDMLEVLEDRSEQRSTIISTQLPVNSWHEVIGEASMGDAICERIVHAAHRIRLKGPSMRGEKAAEAGSAETGE